MKLIYEGNQKNLLLNRYKRSMQIKKHTTLLNSIFITGTFQVLNQLCERQGRRRGRAATSVQSVVTVLLGLVSCYETIIVFLNN